MIEEKGLEKRLEEKLYMAQGADNRRGSPVVIISCVFRGLYFYKSNHLLKTDKEKSGIIISLYIYDGIQYPPKITDNVTNTCFDVRINQHQVTMKRSASA